MGVQSSKGKYNHTWHERNNLFSLPYKYIPKKKNDDTKDHKCNPNVIGDFDSK